jgi:UDP-2,4-diacetamido-2,4,6-trideoxy-beta-L-altropyranose hydrolase
MNIAFRVDASAQIGTGHLARCLTLAGALAARGARARFICREPGPFVINQIRSQGHALTALAAPKRELPADDRDLAHSAWLGVPQADDAEATLAVDGEDWDLLVADHYGLDARWEGAVRRRAKKIFVIDDLADRRHDCDFLLDQNLQPHAIDRYHCLVGSNCIRLVGTRFALLRTEFAHARGRHRFRNRTLNIFFGGSDPKGGTLIATDAILPLCADGWSADIIVGATNPRLEEIRQRCAGSASVTFHVQVSNMADLFSRATLAIGAGGSASLERCCCALPALLTSFADNQRASCEAFAREKAAIDLGPMALLTSAQLRSAVKRIIAHPALLLSMSRRAASLVDGRGVERVMDAVSGSAGVFV